MMSGGRRSNKGKEIEEEVVSTTQAETTQPICQPMTTMGSFFQSSYGGFNPQYLFQPIPSFKPSTTQPFITQPFTTQPSTTQPFITQPITTHPYSMYTNPPTSSFSLPQPSFSQSLSLPSLSESQKLSPTNYHTWHLFMQLLLESAGVWQIIANPLWWIRHTDLIWILVPRHLWFMVCLLPLCLSFFLKVLLLNSFGYPSKTNMEGSQR